MMRCQEIVKQCFWTRTGVCASKISYGCEANEIFSCSEERDRALKLEQDGERRSESDAAEAEWGNEIN